MSAANLRSLRLSCHRSAPTNLRCVRMGLGCSAQRRFLGCTSRKLASRLLAAEIPHGIASPSAFEPAAAPTWTEGELRLSHRTSVSSHCLVHLTRVHLWRRRATDESDVNILLAAISQTEDLREEALPVLPAQARSLVPPTNFAGYGVVEVARLSKTFPFPYPFQASAPVRPSAPLSRGPRLSAHMLRGPAIPSLHPPHSLRTIRPEPPPATPSPARVPTL